MIPSVGTPSLSRMESNLRLKVCDNIDHKREDAGSDTKAMSMHFTKSFWSTFPSASGEARSDPVASPIRSKPPHAKAKSQLQLASAWKCEEGTRRRFVDTRHKPAGDTDCHWESIVAMFVH